MAKIFLFSILIFFGFFIAISNSSANEPAGLARYTLGLPDFDWQMRTSEHYRIHYLPGSVAERQIDTLLERNEQYLSSHLAILETDSFDKIIDLFYFDSRRQIETVVTKPFRALADAKYLTVLAVRNDDEIARDAHEIMHVVSFDLWGGWERRNDLAWLSEGLATYSDVPCNGYSQTELAAYILKDGSQTAPLDSLATSFRQYPEMIGYMLMASFVDYVIDKYGIGTFRELWDKGNGELETVLGKKRPDIEAEWHDYVKEKYPDPKVPDWDDLEKNGCR